MDCPVHAHLATKTQTLSHRAWTGQYCRPYWRAVRLRLTWLEAAATVEAETAPPKTSGGGTMRRFPKRSVAPAASRPSAPPVLIAPAASSDSDADDEDSDAGDAPRRPSHRRRGRARGGRGRNRGRGRGRGRSRARRRSSRRSLGRPQFSPTDLRPPGWEVPDEPARPTVERVQDVFVNQILPWVQRQQMTRGLRRPGMWPTLAEALREHHLLHCPAFAKTGAPP